MFEADSRKKSVFINLSGEWLFHSREGFEEVSREEVLGSEAKIEKPLDKMSVAELTALCIEKEIPSKQYESLKKKAEFIELLNSL